MVDLDKEIAALEAQLAPEPTAEEQAQREKEERVAKLRIDVRRQNITKALAAAKASAAGMYHVEAVDLDERAELDPAIMSWFIVRGSTRKEQRAFDDAQGEAKNDPDGGRARLLALTKTCIVCPKLDNPERTLAFEDAVNSRFGMGLNTLVEKILRLGGFRAAAERAFR